LKLLTPQQRRAVDLVTEGRRWTEVAAEIGIDRTTMWRWRQNPMFEAEINSRRHELWSDWVEHLRNLVPKALEALESELEGRNRLRAAVGILKLAGFDETGNSLGVKPHGQTDPKVIERDRERRRELDELFSTI
jgi:putative insertion element HTH domain-containing protein